MIPLLQYNSLCVHLFLFSNKNVGLVEIHHLHQAHASPQAMRRRLSSPQEDTRRHGNTMLHRPTGTSGFALSFLHCSELWCKIAGQSAPYLWNSATTQNIWTQVVTSCTPICAHVQSARAHYRSFPNNASAQQQYS